MNYSETMVLALDKVSAIIYFLIGHYVKSSKK